MLLHAMSIRAADWLFLNIPQRHRVFVVAAAAAAEARSVRLLTPPDLDSAPPKVIPVPLLPAAIPLVIVAAVEYRFAECLTGDVAVSLIRPVVVELLSERGSGKGRTVEEMCIELNLLIGEVFKVALACGILLIVREGGILTPVMNSWCIASSGFIRLSGSHRRHLVRKSRNGSSSHFKAC